MKQFIIKSNDSGQRLDKFLQKAAPNMPKSLMYKAIRTKKIKVNRKKPDIGYMLKENDIIYCYLNDDLFEILDDREAFMAAPAKIDVIYEDENILLVDKKPGLVVHADETNSADTLINRILHYLHDKGEYDPDNEASFTPALVNRIDRNTGGIVIAVKNAKSLRILNEKLRNREISKKYLCAVKGTFSDKQAVLRAYLKKDSDKKQVFVRERPFDGSKEIITEYRVLSENSDISLLEITLHTGRTHQIRAHMAFIGHPLLGDGKYGDNRFNKAHAFTYQALYSYKLKFIFNTDADILNYLNGKEFETDKIWFLKYLNI